MDLVKLTDVSRKVRSDLGKKGLPLLTAELTRAIFFTNK
jgi:hypothetical protein